jgi:signal transduction histidine kinase
LSKEHDDPRRETVDLRSRHDPEAGLTAALEGYLADWSERTGIAVETWALPKKTVPKHIAKGVYATVVEALANVERHSGAKVVAVAITTGRDGLRVTVSDEGAGFLEESARRSGGRGLAAMRVYFAEIGGTLTINSVLGGGTTITGVVPMND